MFYDNMSIREGLIPKLNQRKFNDERGILDNFYRILLFQRGNKIIRPNKISKCYIRHFFL